MFIPVVLSYTGSAFYLTLWEVQLTSMHSLVLIELGLQYLNLCFLHYDQPNREDGAPNKIAGINNNAQKLQVCQGTAQSSSHSNYK